MNMRCLGIVGWSGSGKTSLIERLLPKMSRAGFKVSVVKHSHHDVVLEPSHKDTARFRAAGAGQVMLVSPFRFALVEEFRGRSEPELSDILLRLDPVDLILVEGYKWAEIPKLEVWRQSEGKSSLYPNDTWIRVVASDGPRPHDGVERELLWLDLNKIDEIYHYISSFARSD